MNHDAKTISSLDELAIEAQHFLQSLLPTLPEKKQATIVALQGNLGSGKTTFTQTCARALGITETLTSPTFVLLKRYPFLLQDPAEENNVSLSQSLAGDQNMNFIHIDAYRIEDPQELAVLGWSELIQNPSNLIFIEWPEKVAPLLPDDIINVHFEFIDETTRRITFPNYGTKEN